MFCNKCGSKIPDESAFCPTCGVKLEIIEKVAVFEPVCPSCGEKLIPGNKFCTKCGKLVQIDQNSGIPAADKEPQNISSPSPIPIQKKKVNRYLIFSVPFIVVYILGQVFPEIYKGPSGFLPGMITLVSLSVILFFIMRKIK